MQFLCFVSFKSQREPKLKFGNIRKALRPFVIKVATNIEAFGFEKKRKMDILKRFFENFISDFLVLRLIF